MWWLSSFIAWWVQTVGDYGEKATKWLLPSDMRKGHAGALKYIYIYWPCSITNKTVMFYSVNNSYIFDKISCCILVRVKVKWLSFPYPGLGTASLNAMRLYPGIQDHIWVFSVFPLIKDATSFNIPYFQIRILVAFIVLQGSHNK